MRMNYYMFPEGTSIDVRVAEGARVVLKNGNEIWPESISDDKRDLIESVDDIIGPMTVTSVKKLMKKYGGSGYTEHMERDGSLFDVTEILLQGNNSEFRYNHHL